MPVNSKQRKRIIAVTGFFMIFSLCGSGSGESLRIYFPECSADMLNCFHYNTTVMSKSMENFPIIGKVGEDSKITYF